MECPIKIPLSACPSVSLALFSGIAHYFFMIFGWMVDNWNILKAVSLICPGKLFFCPNYGPKCCQAIMLQDSLKCNISGKNGKSIFGIQINMEVFYKLILSLWVCVKNHAQSTQNNKFAIFLQYLKNDVSTEVDFLYVDKYKCLPQIDTMILIEIVRHSQISQNSKFLKSLQYLKKKVRDEVDFWINFKVSCKLISTLWLSTFPRKWYYHSYSWSSILKLLKAKRLYYFYNITKKESRSWVHFLHANKHQSFYKLALSCFMEVVRHVQSIQRKLLIFLQFIRNKVSQMQNIHIFYSGLAMFVVTCFSVLLVSHWLQHILTWFLVFSNSKILSVSILLCSIPSLNWAIKLLNWATVSLFEIVIRCIPENNLVGQLYHTVGFIDAFQFCVSPPTLYCFFVAAFIFFLHSLLQMSNIWDNWKNLL